MVRDKLNRIFTSKVFYIVFSLLVSIALWMFVELSLNPTEKKTIDNVQIVLLNEDLLHDKNFVYTSMSPQTLRLTLECERKLHSKLNLSTVYVTVDLANITSVGSPALSYDIVFPQGITKSQMTSITASVSSIIFKVDKLFTKTIPVVGEYKGGTPSEDLQSGAVEFNPSTITIIGPEEAVMHVDRAWVDIKRENLQRTTIVEDLPFVLQYANGDAIEDELLAVIDANVATVEATVPIKMTRDVTLNVDRIYGAGTNEQNVKVNITPSTVQITGEPDAVSEYNSLTIGTIDLSAIDTTTYTDSFTINMPNAFSYQGETEAIVTVEIIGLEIRHFIVTNLQTVNAPKGLTPTIQALSLDIRIRGRSVDLDALLPENISVIADLADYKEGSMTVPVKINFIGEVGDIGPVGGEYRIPVTLSKE